MNPVWVVVLVPLAFYVGTLLGLADARLRTEKWSTVMTWPIVLLVVLVALIWRSVNP